MIADWGELDSDKARGFFAKHGVRLTKDKTNIEEQSDNECGDTGSERSGLRLVVDLRGESDEASDEGE